MYRRTLQMRTGNEIGVLLEIQSAGFTRVAIGARRCAAAVSNLKDNIVRLIGTQ